MFMTKDISGQHVCHFADIEILRYRIDGFEKLSLDEKLLVYHLSEATLAGRDIIWDQNGAYNLRIRHILEQVYQRHDKSDTSPDWLALVEYLNRVWFASGIHHHYSNEKFCPGFGRDYLRGLVDELQTKECLLLEYDARELEDILDEIFDPKRSPKRTQQSGEGDLIGASSINFYDKGIGQQDVEALYKAQAEWASEEERLSPPSYGLNTRVTRTKDGDLYEQPYRIGGLYGAALEVVSGHLKAALAYVQSEGQRLAILSLLSYYKTGDLKHYNDYCIQWVMDTEPQIDFINGFTEVYADPLGIKGSWEGLVHIRDKEASRRTEVIAEVAQWFEDHAPIAPEHKKKEAKGISATVVRVAMLGGDSYPATPLGINLPNADWIRAQHGSKSVTISNIHEAYHNAMRRGSMDEVFVQSAEVRALLQRYDGLTEQLHTDLHECLGHGSGQLLSGVSPDALGAYASVIEEARADLFALYYMADDKLLELELLPDREAYKACYYRYLLNGLVTQLVRIEYGASIEEAHMRNRALIARYALERGEAEGSITLRGSILEIHDYQRLRDYFAELLKEIQRIKSEGDADRAKALIERYAIDIDSKLHQEVLDKYRALGLAPYKGFVNPCLELVWEAGNIVDVRVDYTEGYAEQMLRYGSDYSYLSLNPTKEEKMRHPHPSWETERIAKALRINLRGAMDGIVSASMRQKGLHYGINFGLTMEHIQRRAGELPLCEDLGSYLLSRDVRELKLIGQLVYPAETLDFASATYIAESSFANPELRDCLAKHLFDRVNSAPKWAMAWLFNKRLYRDIRAVAYTVLARWFTHAYRLSSLCQAEQLLEVAFEELNQEHDYISSEQRSALLMLKRWGRSSDEMKAKILNSTSVKEWEQSSSCILQEYVDDLKFELNFA